MTISLKDSIKLTIKSGHIPIIAEIKKFTPGVSLVESNVDIKNQCKIYEEAGVSGISIVTESNFFKGSATDLISVLNFTENTPILLKDFINDTDRVDFYLDLLKKSNNFPSSRITILVIAAKLRDQSENIINYLSAKSFHVLYEINSISELSYIKNWQRKNIIVGFNNKDINNLEIGPNIIRLNKTIASKCKLITGDDIPLISMSGHRTPEDVSKSINEGADAVLIGTMLMQSNKPNLVLKDLQLYHHENH